MSLLEDDIKLLKDLDVPIINADRNYWFVRTQGGDYFEDFYFEGFIGIEWNEVSDLDLIRESDVDAIKGMVFKYYPKIDKVGYVAKQIKKFACDIKKGDIVLIPNKNSEKIAFGEIKSEPYIYEEDKSQILDFFDDDDIKESLKKRIDVKWLKVLKRSELDPYLYKIIYSHSTIVDARPYANFIDRTLHKFYVKNDDAHLTMDVNTRNEIPAIDLSGFIYETIGLVDSFNYNMKMNLEKKEISTKINVQSPGIIEFVGPVAIIGCIAIGAVVLLGGEVSFLNLKLKTDGLSKNILEWVKFLKENKENNKVGKAGEVLKVTTPYINEISATSEIEHVEEDNLKDEKN